MKPKAPELRYYFDVFGTIMRAERMEGCWQLFRESGDGKSGRVNEVVIPHDLPEEELATFLDDMFHEFASTANNKVKKLG